MAAPRLPPVGQFLRLPVAQRTRRHVTRFRNNIDEIVQAGGEHRALRVTYVHKDTTDGPTPGYPPSTTTLPRLQGHGLVEKETIVRTLIPRSFLLGRNNNLLCWCSDVTDYEGNGLVADADLVHVKHFLVRNMTIIRSATIPPDQDGVHFDMTSVHLGVAAHLRPDQYM